jgi:hypothetical protein
MLFRLFREIMVSRVSELVKQLRVRRWIRKWRRFTALQIRRRKEKQTFPACPSRLVFDQQIASLKSKGESPGVSLKRKSLVEQTVSVKRCNSLSGKCCYISLLIEFLFSNLFFYF